MKNKKIEIKLKHFFIIIFILFVVIIISGNKKETQTQNTPPQPSGKEIKYTIINEENTSYLNCNRVGIRIVVPDDSPLADVDYTLKIIVDKYRNSWDDITIWAYKESETDLVGLIGYTMGMKEYSICN